MLSEPSSIVEGPPQPSGGKSFSSEDRKEALAQKEEPKDLTETVEQPQEQIPSAPERTEKIEPTPSTFDPGEVYVTQGKPGEEDLIAEADEVITIFLRDGKHSIVKFKNTGPGFIDPLRIITSVASLRTGYQLYLTRYRVLAGANDAT